MTYNDIATPIRKTLYGEGDIIFTFITAHHGRVDAIAKGIRKSTSRKRGNIEYGMFSTLQFAKGKNMDIVTEAQMLEYNSDLLSSQGVKYLYSVLPIINKFATDVEHCEKIFELMKNQFMSFDENDVLKFEILTKYYLLDIQDSLPDFGRCSRCFLKFERLGKYAIDSKVLICNNCARKYPSAEIEFVTVDNLDRLENSGKEVILNMLYLQVKNITT
jgi:DNA repair protein RecO (recombination protein O)